MAYLLISAHRKGLQQFTYEMLIRQAKQTIYCEESYLKVEYQENQSTVMFCLGRYSGNIMESSTMQWRMYLERTHLPLTNFILANPAHEL